MRVDVVGERKEGRGEERRVGRGEQRDEEGEEVERKKRKDIVQQSVLTYPNFSYFVVLEGVLCQCRYTRVAVYIVNSHQKAG